MKIYFIFILYLLLLAKLRHEATYFGSISVVLGYMSEFILELLATAIVVLYTYVLPAILHINYVYSYVY